MKSHKKGERFECTVCGDCCTGFSVVIDPWVEDGIVHMVREGSVGVEVWPWEARLLIPEAQASGKDLILLPSNVILDKMRDTAIALSYFVANESCPFLEGKECTIYKERPNVCRYFPLVLGSSGLDLSDRCPETVRPRTRATGKDKAQALRDIYGDHLDHMMRDIYIHENQVDLLGRLELDGAVKWDWEPDPDHVLKKVQGQEWMDLLEFIIDIGFMTSKEAERMVVDLLYAENLDEKIDLGMFLL